MDAYANRIAREIADLDIAREHLKQAARLFYSSGEPSMAEATERVVTRVSIQIQRLRYQILAAERAVANV